MRVKSYLRTPRVNRSLLIMLFTINVLSEEIQDDYEIISRVSFSSVSESTLISQRVQFFYCEKYKNFNEESITSILDIVNVYEHQIESRESNKSLFPKQSEIIKRVSLHNSSDNDTMLGTLHFYTHRIIVHAILTFVRKDLQFYFF